MMYNKLNLDILLFLMIISVMMLFFSMNMIVYKYIIMVEWLIFSLNSCNISGPMIFYYMSLVFLSTVSFICAIVILYSGLYMEKDKFIIHFMYMFY